MHPDDKRQIIERAKVVVETGVPDMGPQTRRVAVGRYTDRRRLEAEQALFKTFPQPVAAAADLAEGGDWLSSWCAGNPVLVTRQTDGTLRAFLNVCRHRGSLVAPLGRGKGRRRFSCPYHAWQYGADGSLMAIRHDVGFSGIDKKEFGLRALAVQERAGLIWVIPDPSAADHDISELLGPLADEIEGFGLKDHVGHGQREFEIAANWKLVTDGSLEDYHFKILHNSTSGVFFLDTAQIVDSFGVNSRIFLPKRNICDLEREDIDGIDIREFGNILYFFFPGVWFLVQPDHAMVSFVSPKAVDATVMSEIALIPPISQWPQQQPEGHWDVNVDLFRTTLDEDYRLVPDIQRALASEANTHLLFGRYEQELVRFHEHLDRFLAEPR